MPDIYPFEFLGPDYSKADEWMRYSLNYKFVSEKSNHSYIVRIESYVQAALPSSSSGPPMKKTGEECQQGGTWFTVSL